MKTRPMYFFCLIIIMTFQSPHGYPSHFVEACAIEWHWQQQAVVIVTRKACLVMLKPSSFLLYVKSADRLSSLWSCLLFSFHNHLPLVLYK
jgi:hypothetical protein